MIKFLIPLLFSIMAFADTPPPSAVKIKGGTDGTIIGNVGDSQNVAVTNSISATVSSSLGSPLYTQLVNSGVILDPRVIRALNQGTDSITTYQGGAPWAFSVASLPLPPDAATATLQGVGNSSLSSIATSVTGVAKDHVAAATPGSVRLSDGTAFYKGTTPADTQPISASALPLPANASKETGGNLDSIAANSSTIATHETSIDGKIPSGLAVNAGRLAVDPGTITFSGAVSQGAPNTIGNRWPVQPTDGTNSQAYTSSGAAKVDGSATSQPVVQAIGTNLHTVVDALPATAATVAAQNTGNASLTSLDGKTVHVDTGAVVVASSALATNAAQETGGHLASADSKLSTVAQDTTVANVQGSVTGGTAATKSSLSGGVFQSVSPTLTNNQQSALQLDSSGNLKTTSTVSGNVNVINTPTVNIGTTGGLALDSSVLNLSAKFGSLGQALMSGSAPVVIASNQSAIPVTGTFFQATQPVSGSLGRTWTLGVGDTIGLNAGSNTIGKVDQGVGGASAWKTDGSATIQPISAAALPLPANASQETGGNLASVATSASAINGKLGSLGQKLMSGSTPMVLASDQSAIPVTGTFFQATQPVSGVGNFTVTQSTGTNLHTVVDSGIVTSNIGTTGGLALDTSVTGLQVSQGSTTSGQRGGLSLGAVTTAAPTYTTAQSSPLSLTTAGALRTDGSATTQPTSGVGTFTVGQATGTNLHAVIDSGSTTAVTQATAANLNATVVQSSGANLHVNVDSSPAITGTVNQGTPNSAANRWPVQGTDGTNSQSYTAGGSAKVDGSATTQPISASALPLPANASKETGGNLDSITTNTSTTATNVAALQVTQGSTTSGQKGNMIQGAVTTAAPTYVTAQTSPLSLTTAGALRTDASSSTQPVSGTGNFTVVQTTGSNLHAQLDSGSTTAVTQATAANLNATVVQATGTNLHTVVDSSGLPTGAATSALQTTGNTSLSSIDTKTPALGQTSTLSASVPVVQPADLAVVAQNITTQDLATTTTAQAYGQNSFSGTPTAGSAATFSLSSYQSGVILIKGTWTGSLQVESSEDGGSTWIVNAMNLLGGSIFQGTFTANAQGIALLAGKTNVRVRATAAITGTASVSLVNTMNSHSMYIANSLRIADGAVPSVVTPLTIKPVSTAATAADTAAVVAVSPGTPISTKTSLTASSPTAVSVGVATTAAVASNATRKGLCLVNTSINTISLGIGVSAVLNSGITLYPGGSWCMEEYNFSTAAVNAIASAAASNLSVQEFTP